MGLGPIILQIVLIFLNAVFASAEIAVISMNDAKLKKLMAQGSPKAIKLSALTSQPAKFLATIQVAITMAGLLGSAFAAENFADVLSQELVKAEIPVPEAVIHASSVVLITLILAYFNIVFGELLPKRIAMKKAESMALGMAGMLTVVSKIFAPIVWLLTASTNGLLKLMHMNPQEEEERVSEEEIKMLLITGSQQGTIDTEESELIQNVFEFDDIRVEQICTHRVDTAALFLEDTMEEWEQVIMNRRHTYYPVCGENRDDVIGVLDTRDYFRLSDKSRGNIMAQAVEKAYFVPERTKANILLQNMKKKKTYFAVVMDEYGGMSGIITLHDLVEALVGEIVEEEEEKPEDIVRVSDREWKIRGAAPLDEVAAWLNRELPVDKYDTFGGYIISIIDRIPEDGESFLCEADGFRIEVNKVENHRIMDTTLLLCED